MNVPEINVKDFDSKLKSQEKFVLLDVRETWELAEATFKDARLVNLPLSILSQKREAAFPEDLKNPETEIVVSCHSGARSADVTRWLIQLGYKNVRSLRGGIFAYAREVDQSVGMY